MQGDQANSSSLYQYAGIMKVLAKHPDFQVVAKPDSNWDATTSRNVTTTMLQQHPDICAIIDFWDGDATGAFRRHPRRQAATDKVFLVTTGGGEKAADCDKLQDGTYGAVVMTDLARQSADMNAIIKFLLQSGQPAGTSHTYIYTLEKATTKADLKPDSCWDLKAAARPAPRSSTARMTTAGATRPPVSMPKPRRSLRSPLRQPLAGLAPRLGPPTMSSARS